MTPYYEQDGITIYHADCRDVILPADALVCDPPYGVDLGSSDSRGNKHGLAKASYASYDDSVENFNQIVVPAVSDALTRVKRGAVFAGKHITSWPAPALVGGIYCSEATGRNPWGYTNLFAVLFYGHDPMLHKGARHTILESNEIAERNGHPCPKPIGWMKWLIGRVAMHGETIIDPFMGSGTTLVAAKQLGNKAIGIEIEEQYCEIAAKRLAQRALEFSA